MERQSIEGLGEAPRKIDLHPERGWDIATLASGGGLLFLGHHGRYLGKDGQLLESIEEQTEGCLRALEESLQALGGGLGDLLKVTVILRRAADFDRMHEVWRRVLLAPYPARTTITSDFVDSACLIQVEAVAALPRSQA